MSYYVVMVFSQDPHQYRWYLRVVEGLCDCESCANCVNYALICALPGLLALTWMLWLLEAGKHRQGVGIIPVRVSQILNAHTTNFPTIKIIGTFSFHTYTLNWSLRKGKFRNKYYFSRKAKHSFNAFALEYS